jgi:hypothetical protein
MLRFIQVRRRPAAWLNPDKREIPGLPDAGFSGHSGPAVSTRHSAAGNALWRSRLWGHANSSKRTIGLFSLTHFLLPVTPPGNAVGMRMPAHRLQDT